MEKLDQWKNIPDSWKYIKRSDNPNKGISSKARFILSSALFQIRKYGQAILTHNELTKITEAKIDQNCILVKQIAFVLDIKFHRSLTENNKKYQNVYQFLKKQNTDEILENPENYFSNNRSKKIGAKSEKIRSEESKSSPKKIGAKSEKIRSEVRKNSEQQRCTTYISKKKDKINDKDKVNQDQNNQSINQDFISSKSEDFDEIKSQHFKEKAVATIDGITNKSNSVLLSEFQYSKSMLEEIRVASNKPYFTHCRIEGLISYLSTEYPDKSVFGGRQGFIRYMTKVVNGEKDYDKPEDKTSVREKERKELEQWDYDFKHGIITYLP